MTTRIAIADLVPGDVVQDLITAGTVAHVTEPTRSGGVRVDYEFGGCFVAPATFTVVTTREPAEVDQ